MYHRGLGHRRKVGSIRSGSIRLTLNNSSSRGSKFLKRWVEFLEENADLRYPNAAELFSV